MTAAGNMPTPPITALRTPVLTRGWTRPTIDPAKMQQPTRKRAPSVSRGIETDGPVLIFDTETTVDAAQTLTFGSWRFGQYEKGGRLVILQEGLFYADDLAETDQIGYRYLVDFAASHSADIGPGVLGADRELKLISRRHFAGILFRAIEANAIIVNFNKPFDLSRIAISAGAARGKRYGGFSLRIWDNEFSRPRVVVKPVDSKASFTELTRPPKTPLRPGNGGRFLDLRTLGFALDGAPYTLASACAKWEVEHPKQKIEKHGVITPEYIAYNRADTRSTAELSAKMFSDLENHPIDAKPEHLMSPAGIAKKYLTAMGINPRMRLQLDFPAEIMGAAMSTFYGGRAECKIRRTPMPVEVHDFTSMYPTVNTLMGLWGCHTAKRIRVQAATKSMQMFLDTVTLDNLFDPTQWPKLIGIAQIVPDGDILPVRARYGNTTDDNPTIGINPLWSKDASWFTIADLVASKLLTGRTPTIIRAVRFVPSGSQAGLTPVRLGGDVLIDPATDDFFKTVIEQRVPVKDEPLGKFLKVLANSGSYGIFAQFDRQDLAPENGQHIDVFDGRDDGNGNGNGNGNGFTVRTNHPETPGPFAFPPIAAVITGGARLMLAMLERSITDLGGSWVFGDTDSMAIVATHDGGPIECPGGDTMTESGEPAVLALSFEQTRAIRERFGIRLNPYDRAHVPELLKSEYQGLCFAVSAKRYACYTIQDRKVIVDSTKVSEHGLGHLVDPTIKELTKTMQIDGMVRKWVIDAWQWIITKELGLPAEEPRWLERPAVGRLTVTSHELLKGFSTYNKKKPWAAKVKPMNFMLTIGAHPLSDLSGRLVAPYESDSSRWTDIEWIHQRTGARGLKISTDYQDTDRIPVETFRIVMDKHVAHPESKFVDSNADRCVYDTVGLLYRRATVSTGREVIGKESNRIEEVQTDALDDDPTLLYLPAAGVWPSAMAVLSEIPTRELRQQLNARPSQQVNPVKVLSIRQLTRIIIGESTPRNAADRDALTEIASSIARERIAAIAPHHDWASDRDNTVIHAYLEQPAKERKCECGCGPLARGRRRWASDACRKRGSQKGEAPPLMSSLSRV